MLAAWVWPAAWAGAAEVPEKPAESLYLALGEVGLDPARVYQVRDASLNRSSVQITLEDGKIGFTKDVMGKITGAFFEGDGEILLTPPNEVERKSLSLFTGMAILEEHFATAYFRFNDDTAAELRPDLRQTEDKQEFIDHWESAAKNLAIGDAMRLLVSFSRMLPAKGNAGGEGNGSPAENKTPDRFLHARLQGEQLGVFDVYVDSMTTEEIQAGQPKTAANGETYYDVWTSFSPQSRGRAQSDRPYENPIAIRKYTIATEVLPPKEIRAKARLNCEALESGGRALLFELSRFLEIQGVTLAGKPVEFIHNPAMEGTQLSRRGNDIVAVVLPEPLRAGQKLELEFVYGGEVLAAAGGGLLYVGARGTWYPNRGMEMADFDLEFRYPQEWTLIATGKPSAVSPEHAAKSGEQVSHWVAERPMPVAGFNLGKYREATTKAGDVTVETYATQDVERDFPSGRIEVIAPTGADPKVRAPEVVVPPRPSPARNEVRVGDAAAKAIEFFAERFGPFPYSHLSLTQMPGRASQGWPELIFLSSYAFLDEQQREQLHFDSQRSLLQESIPAHETAHQWWGDLIGWSSYRDQWFSEGLANYSAMMMLQDKNPPGFREIMEQYRDDLLEKNKDGMTPVDAGPVTLGTRLLSSRFPEGYEAISYGRGTWLFHMLRTMLDDAGGAPGKRNLGPGEEPFVRALKKLRQQYEGKTISTRELLDVFAEDLPQSLRYEGKKSLDWFLDGWVNGTAVPRLELKAARFTAKGSAQTVAGTILQKDAPRDLITSVPVYGVASGRQLEFLGRVFADGEESSFRLSVPAGVHKIVLDPFETVLRQR